MPMEKNRLYVIESFKILEQVGNHKYFSQPKKIISQNGQHLM